MFLSKAQQKAIVWAATVAIHVWIAVGVASIDKAKTHRGPTSISMRDRKKKTEEKKPEPAKEKPPEPKAPEAKKAQPAPKRPATQPEAPKPVAEAAPVSAPANAAPVAELGLTFGNALGSGPGGIHVPTGGNLLAAAPTASAKPQPKVLGAKAPSGGVEECSEPPAKPKPIKVVQPAYTASAREAQVEGRVRVEISVDANGNVTGAKVLQGLGHGLDEAALAAAKSSTFAAATRCGKSVPATFVIGMRFAL